MLAREEWTRAPKGVHATWYAELIDSMAPGVKQVHGTRVVDWNSCRPDLEADGILCDQPGQQALVRTADCMPVAIAGDGIVAAVHAGWRGLAAGVLESAIEQIRQSGVGDLRAAIGPAIRRCCFEADHAIATQLGLRSDDPAVRVLPGPAAWRLTDRGNPPPRPDPHGDAPRIFIDLQAVARDRLAVCGVDDVMVIGPCTACSTVWPSYRATGRSDRMALVVGIGRAVGTAT